MSDEGYISVPGGRVWYQVLGPETEGIPLLCLHGGPGLPHDYIEALADLADRRPVIFYDQLGCGRSDRPDDTALWTVERFTDELVAVREALKLDRLHLFGSSWGGMLALWYASERQAPLESIIAAGSPASVTRWIEHTSKLRAELPEDVRAVLDRHEAAGFFDCPEFIGAVAVFYQRHLCRLNPWPDGLERAFAGIGTAVYQTMWGPTEFGPVWGRLKDWDLSDRLKEIHVPSLLTVGRFDECPVEHVAEMQDRMPQAELVVFEQGSHLHFFDEREHYMAVVNAFLDRVENAAGAV